MKCSKCGYENLLKASYCYSCGNAFTDKEKQAAREKAMIGKLEKAEEIKNKADKIGDILSMKFITDNAFVRLVLILIPFVLSLVLGGGDFGNTMKIRDSSQYDVYYNTTTKEYFVDMDTSNVNLMLYVPKSTSTINVYFTDSYGNESQQGCYSIRDAIVINENTEGHYTIEAVMADQTQTITMYTV